MKRLANNIVAAFILVFFLGFWTAIVAFKDYIKFLRG